MKKMKMVFIENISYDIASESLGDVIDILNVFNTKYSCDYKRLYIETGRCPDLLLYGERLETDDEYNSRIQRDKSKQTKKEEAEKVLLAQLKAKYEG